MERIKICHLTTVHNINDPRIFEKECSSLAKFGFEVTLLACGNEYYSDRKNNVERIVLNIPVRNRIERIIKRSREIYIKALEIDASLYHFHDPELLPIGLKLKKHGKKVIFDSHEFYGQQLQHKMYIPYLVRNLIAYCYNQYEKYVCKRLDAVVQVCTIQGKDYFSNRSKKSIFLTNVPLIKENSILETTDFENRKAIAHIGSLTYNRGITHLIKAAYLSETKLILAGKFESEEYFTFLRDQNEFSNVDYRGYLSHKDIYTTLNECFVGVSTLLNVGQYNKTDIVSTKVYEYLYAGIPVINSNTRYAENLIQKYNCGICVEPDNIQQIVSAVTYLKNNPVIAKKLGENGRLAILKELNWENEEIKLISLYNEILIK